MNDNKKILENLTDALDCLNKMVNAMSFSIGWLQSVIQNLGEQQTKIEFQEGVSILCENMSQKQI